MNAIINANGAAVQRLYHFWEARVMNARRTEQTYYFFLPDEEAVRQEVKLLDAGSHVLWIKERHHARWQREIFSRDYKLTFLQTMQYHTDIGASPGTALMRVILNEQNPRKRIDLEPALQIYKSGGTFSEAIEAIDIFDKPIIAMLKAGETSGLDQAIKDAIELLESREGVLVSFLTVLGRVTRDLLLAVVSVFSVQYFWFPHLEKSAPQTGDPLKIAEYNEAIQNGYFYNSILVWIAVVVCSLFVAGILAMVVSRKARDEVSEAMIKLPVVRSMVYDNLLSDSFLLLSRMVGAKVNIPLMNAVLILASVAPISPIRKIWMRINDRLGSGETFPRAIFEQKILRNHETMSLDAYSSNDHLSKILMAMSKDRRKAAEKSTNRFKSVVTYITFAYIGASIMVALMVMRVQDLATAIGFESLMK